MSRLFSSILFSFFLFFQTTSFAEEGDIEHLVVPETQDEHVASAETEVSDITEVEESIADAPQIIDNETAVEQIPQEIAQNKEAELQTGAQSATEQMQTEAVEETPVEETPVEEGPSEDELEATRAEESELREVGAGEEPAIE